MGAVAKIREIVKTNLGLEFVYGTQEYVNAEATNTKDIQTKDLVYMAPLISTGAYEGGFKTDRTYQAIIGWCVKNDGTYQSNMDEYYEQKYDRRLGEMTTSLEALIKTIACTDGFEVTSDRVFEEINQFDENLDVVIAELSFIYNGD